jgi:hypothetical protein
MAENQPILDDAQVQAKWAELSPLLDRMMERVESSTEFPVLPSSSLAGDNQATKPYHLCYAIRQCLGAGVDHLHAVKVLVVDQQVLHLAAPASLARGALENFAAAYWILQPAKRTERVERSLRWHAQNFRDQEKAVGRLGLPGHRSLDEKLQRLEKIGAVRGIEATAIRSGYKSTAVITYVEATLSDSELGVLLPWQICSGFAHGRPWAYLGVSEREESPSDETDALNVRLTNDLSRALYPTLAAMRLLEKLLRLYQARSGASLG